MIAELSYVDLDSLLAAIGEHHVSARSVAQQRGPRRSAAATTASSSPATVDCGRDRATAPRADTVGVHVEGLDDVLVRLARCCTPVPGDEIIGFVTRGRGVSVHRADCANAVSLDERAGDADDRRRVGRRAQHGAMFRAGVEVVALDRSRLLRDVANALVRAARQHRRRAAPHTGDDRVAKMRFEFELADPGHLDRRAAHDQADRRRLRRLPHPPRCPASADARPAS